MFSPSIHFLAWEIPFSPLSFILYCAMGLRKGEEVEVCSDEEGFKGAWYPATVIGVGKRGSEYTVEYKDLLSEDEKSKLREQVEADAIRPAPPCLVRQHFVADEIVDAHDKDGWWTGTIQNVLPHNNYLVRFTHSSGEKSKFNVSQLRLHLDWVDAKWVSQGIQAEAEGISGERNGAESERKRRKRSEGNDKVGSSGRGAMKMNMNAAGTGRDVEGAKEGGKRHSSAPHANVSSSKQTQVPIVEQVENGEAETTLDAAANPTKKKIELLAFNSVLRFY